MRIAAIVELPAASTADTVRAMIRATYRASRRGPAVLLSAARERADIDRHLDLVVSADRRVHGVAYRDPDDAEVWRGVSAETVVVAASSQTRRRAESAGARCIEMGAGLAALTALANS